MTNAQQWLREQFPNETAKAKVKTLSLIKSTISRIDLRSRISSLLHGLAFPSDDWKERVFDLCLEEIFMPETKIDESSGDFCYLNQMIEGKLEIEGFSNLEKLIITEQMITNLYVEKTPKLDSLTCSFYKKLVNLDIRCPILITLQIDNNPILQNVNLDPMFQLTDFYFEKIGCGRAIFDKLNLFKRQAEERKRLLNILAQEQSKSQALAQRLQEMELGND